MKKINDLPKGMQALCVDVELQEVLAVHNHKKETVKLKRTFNQKTYSPDLKVTGVIKFWRVIGPETHKNYQSDLSLDGLKEWGII